MRVFTLPVASARAQGQAFGEAFRHDIAALAALRSSICVHQFGFSDVAHVRTVARAHGEATAAELPERYEELCGIAEGAALPIEDIITLNHYTDMRDEMAAPKGDEGGCSMVWTPGLLAQTWDMHISAMPFVMALEVPAQGECPSALLFTLTGCLGMAGINQHGVCVAINNLRSTDAHPGSAWPALVRHMLGEATCQEAARALEGANVASGHHYLICDANNAVSIETSGRQKTRRELSGPSFAHTNHALTEEVAAHSEVPGASTTYARLSCLNETLAQATPASIEDAFAMLGSRDGYPGSPTTNTSSYERPHGSATCGAIAMDASARRALLCAGFADYATPLSRKVE